MPSAQTSVLRAAPSGPPKLRIMLPWLGSLVALTCIYQRAHDAMHTNLLQYHLDKLEIDSPGVIGCGVV